MKQLPIEGVNIDVHGLLQSLVPLNVPTRFVQPSSVRIEDLSAEQETLVRLQIEKIKAVQDLEKAQKKRVEL